MDLIYDVSATAIAWRSIAWMLFFWIFIGFGAFAIPYLVAQHVDGVGRGGSRALMLVAVLFNAIFAWWLIDGFIARQVCIGLASGETSHVTGKVSSFNRSTRGGKTYFYVGDRRFVLKTSSPGRECGFTESLDEISPPTDGDLLRIEYSGLKILRVWREARTPA
jgi:hypothetical protein